MDGVAVRNVMRVLVVDDEPAARRKVLRFLDEHPNVEVCGEASSGRDAVERIIHERPDVVLLDVQMPDMDGFEVAEAVADCERVPQIIFTTAHDEYAVRAFEISALDYLLKPFDRERFARALNRARDLIDKADTGLPSSLVTLLDAIRAGGGYARRILVSADRHAVFVNANEIIRIEAERNYVTIHHRRGAVTMRSTLDTLERKLDPQQFVRIHRSHLVNIDAVTEIHPWFHGDFKVRLLNGTELMWSRRYAAKRPDIIP